MGHCNKNDMRKLVILLLSIILFQSCSYQFFVTKEHVIHEEIGFLLITGNNDYFIPCKLKNPIDDNPQQYISPKYLNSFAILVTYDNNEKLAELRNVYGTPFFIQNKSCKSLVTKGGYNPPKDSTCCYLIPVELQYYMPKSIFKEELYTETWKYGNETIEFKYKSEQPCILSITPYFTEKRQYFLQDKWYNQK